MKLVIQIPCFNEKDNIKAVLEDIPKKINSIDEIYVLVIDDGSKDETSEIAKEFGADEIIKFNKNYGLSHAFKAGLKRALSLKADILVNLDGDNQYCAKSIEKLIQPILEKKADIVLGTRPIDKIETFSPLKKALQKFGSFVVKVISKEDIKDAATGFRAFSRQAIMNLNIFNPFSYTIESIIQANIKNLKIENVEIEVNEQKNRKSRLFKNSFIYIYKQMKNLIRFYIIYRPARFFISIANIFLVLGLLLGGRFLYFFFSSSGSGHVQSLILCAIILILAFFCYLLAIIGDLFSINRKLLEEIQFLLKDKLWP